MKKSKVLTLVGILIIITVILATVGKSHSYEKKMHYNSTDEVIAELNSKPLAAFKDNRKIHGNIIYSDSFYECLSKRKRVTCPAIDYSKLNVRVNNEKNNEENKERIKAKYISLGRNINSFKETEKIEACSLTGTSEDLYDKSVNKIDMDVVFIDEGEGWVIDYFMINSQGNKNDPNK
ncbi:MULTISPECIES: hypothetical protein [Clostridium]|uniref:Lipoprotein n=1 Tax=Clostridium cibarium TaxID=2762247 RepID=A0ABR8PWA4_9CLOT|nr:MULTISPECIES: hypothetical protein [Clostridium]MBD7912413.1 hypothetical protein [Clostridium cibarium]